MSGLVEHLERHLGRIDGGWRAEADGHAYQLVRYAGGSGHGDTAVSTLGLSRHALHSAVSGRPVHLELLLLVAAPVADPAAVLDALADAADRALTSGHAWLRGDVLPLARPLAPGGTASALYVSAPVYLPDAFAVCRTEGVDVVVAWLVPVTADEAGAVREHGWDWFEDRLVEVQPELTDPCRASVLAGPAAGSGR